MQKDNILDILQDISIHLEIIFRILIYKNIISEVELEAIKEDIETNRKIEINNAQKIIADYIKYYNVVRDKLNNFPSTEKKVEYQLVDEEKKHEKSDNN